MAVTLMTFLYIADQQNLLAAHTNNHANVAADHANASPHVNAGAVAVSGIGGHTNTASGHSNLGHCSMANHFNATPHFNNHTNVHNSVMSGHANNTHNSHSSHGQW